MRSSIAARRFRHFSKFVSLFCAAALCCGLMPSAALAADDTSLSLIPEGGQGAVPIVSGAEGGDADAVSHYASNDPSSVDGGSAASTSEDVIDIEGEQIPPMEDLAEDAQEGDSPSAVPAVDIVNQTMPLELIAQGEATRSYFLAQTLESTRTVPVVSASLPLDKGAEGGHAASAKDKDSYEPSEDGEDSKGSDPAPGIIAADSTVVGSFEYMGMTFAIEAGGESVSLVAVDYTKLPERFIQNQFISIPEMATDNGIDFYSVTRIADDAFSSLTEESANPDYVGCDRLLANRDMLSKGGVESSEGDVPGDSVEGRIGILVLGIPASVTNLEEGAFTGFDTLQYAVVSEDNPSYVSYDGVLYDADPLQLRFIPEGRTGVVSIALDATDAYFEKVVAASSISALAVNLENDAWKRIRTSELSNIHGEIVEIMSATDAVATDASAKSLSFLRVVTSLMDAIDATAPAAAEEFTNLDLIESSTYAAPNSNQARFNSNSGTLTILWAPLDSNNYQPYASNQITWPLYWENGADCFMAAAGGAYWVSRYRGDELIDVTLRWFISASRPGYTLTGWKTQTGAIWAVNSFTTKTIPGGTHFTAQWAGNPYAVSFNANHGSGGQTAAVTATYGSAMPAITSTPPTRLGYEFKGWYDTAAETGGTQYYSATGASMRSWDKTTAATLYARWAKRSTVQAHFWAMDGSIHVMKSPYSTNDYATYKNGASDWSLYWYADTYAILTYYGQAYWVSDYTEDTLTSTFQKWFLQASRTGYELLGWKQDNGTFWPVGDFETKQITGGHYFAQWDPCKYTVSFNPNGGSGGQSTSVTATYDAGMPTITSTKPLRAGYTFEGWWDTSAASGGTQYYTAEGASANSWKGTANTTLYARWTPNKYTVSFSLNNGKGTTPSDVTATYDAGMPILSTTVKPTRDGYDFMGWYDNENYAASGSTQYYTAAGASACAWNKASGATLYAGWEKHTYTITWNAQGGTVDATGKTSQTFGNELALPPTPAREGYTFVGWWTTSGEGSSDSGEKVVEGTTTVPAFDATYFARWDKVSDKVRLKAAGGTFTQEQVDAFNETSGAPEARLLDDGTEVEITFDVNTKSFALDGLKPALTGAVFSGWDPAFVVPSWSASNLSWNDARTYTATWSTNSYGVTYRDKNGDSLVGWSAWENGPSLESELPQAFNEATSEADRVLPEKPYKLGYTWVKWSWPHDGIEEIVTSIPDVSSPVTIIANFTANPYTVKMDLVGGEGQGWPESYVRDYDDPTIELPVAAPKRAGYVFAGLKAYASEEESAPAVDVIDTATNLPVNTLQPGRTYKVLDLADGKGGVYDVKVLRAVWTPRIAVDVTPSIDMGILADYDTNILKFQHGGTDYVVGNSENVYAPLTFISYTTAPVGIVAIAEDTEDDGYADRASFAEKVFGGAVNKAQVSFTVSADKNGSSRHAFALGGSTSPDASGFLDGLTIAAPSGDEPATTTLYLGMDFGSLTAMDLLNHQQGKIAKLYYTVALIGDSDSESVLGSYDGNGIIW